VKQKENLLSHELEDNLTGAYIMGFVKIASTNDLKPGEMKSVEVEQKEICLTNVNGNFYAIGNKCTHAGCMLSDGKLDGPNIKCSCHFSVFNVQTGAVVKGPATEPEPVYQVKLENDQILIDV
jgi:nitrite reductase/ring-hydroxylating ferredoxin subunit